jgi:hypothetical protein
MMFSFLIISNEALDPYSTLNNCTVVAKLILTFSSLGPESKPQWEGIIEGE